MALAAPDRLSGPVEDGFGRAAVDAWRTGSGTSATAPKDQTRPVDAETAFENSDVLPPGSVAVAVILRPAVPPAASVTLKLALPRELVDTVADPRNVSPS